MKVLVIGSGGREHALAWKLSTSPQVSKVFVAPGNDGMSLDNSTWERWPVAQEEFSRLAEMAVDAKIDLVVVGPDNPLAEGIVDVLESAGLSCFGPSAQAARLESSKAFAKEIMKAAGVPSARFFLASSQAEAQKILKSVPWKIGGGWVVKADGLALGKGVKVCRTYEEAVQAVDELISVSGSLVIEEFLYGEEISWLAFCDGERCALLEPARDYKTLKDHGEGPNTGGMGAYSPVPEVPAHWYARVHSEVFLPVLREMKKRGTPFKGVLYAGLMADFSGERFSVLEFNARFGDPETQVLLPRMSDDLFSWCSAAAAGDISNLGDRVKFSSEVAVGVVGAARGYPENPEKNRPLKGPGLDRLKVSIEEVSGSSESSGSSGSSRFKDKRVPEYFFAGVKNSSNELVSSGGRVFLSLGMAGDFKTARSRAYELFKEIYFDGVQSRADIAVQTVGGIS